MFVTPLAKDLFRLNNFSCEAIAMADALWTGASLDKLWRDPEIAQVSLLFDRVSAEHFEEFGHGTFG